MENIKKHYRIHKSIHNTKIISVVEIFLKWLYTAVDIYSTTLLFITGSLFFFSFHFLYFSYIWCWKLFFLPATCYRTIFKNYNIFSHTRKIFTHWYISFNININWIKLVYMILSKNPCLIYYERKMYVILLRN